jgi:hypothetical protein
MLDIGQVKMSENPLNIYDLKIASDISKWEASRPYIAFTVVLIFFTMFLSGPLFLETWGVGNLMNSTIVALILGCGFWVITINNLSDSMQGYIRLGYSEEQLVERFDAKEVSRLVWAYKYKQHRN